MSGEVIKYTGIYSMGLCGYEVGVDEAQEVVFYRFVGPSGPKPGQKAKIRYTSKGRPYFLANNRRVHLDECLRKHLGPCAKSCMGRQ